MDNTKNFKHPKKSKTTNISGNCHISPPSALLFVVVVVVVVVAVLLVNVFCTFHFQEYQNIVCSGPFYLSFLVFCIFHTFHFQESQNIY